MEIDTPKIVYVATREFLVRAVSFTILLSLSLLLIMITAAISNSILAFTFSFTFALWGMYIWRVVSWIRSASAYYWKHNTPPYSTKMPEEIPVLDLIFDLLNDSFATTESTDLEIAQHGQVKRRILDNFGLGGIISLISLSLGGLVLENRVPTQLPNVQNADVSALVALAAALLGSVYGSIIVAISSLLSGNLPNDAIIGLISFIPPMIFFAIALRNLVWLLECSVRYNIERHRTKPGIFHSTTATIALSFGFIPICFLILILVLSILAFLIGY